MVGYYLMTNEQTQLDRIEEKLDQMLSNTANVQTLVEKVVAEVKPTLDALMQSSLFKMLGMKGK